MHKLSDPAIISDNQQFQKLSKERSDMTELAQVYTDYKATKKNIDENRKMVAHEKDPEMRQMAKEEIAPLEEKLKSLEEHLKILLLPKDPNDERNIFLEIRAGTGGDEAALFAAELFRMYTRFAETKRWKIEVVESSGTGKGGFKEIIAQIRGQKVYSLMKYESGVHRVQRVPETEQMGRVHTSAVTVAVLPEPDEVEAQIDKKDLRIDTYSAGGPGGQHVNKTQSAVRLTHIPSGLVVACMEERSQHKNMARAMKLLQARLFDLMLQKQQDEMAKTRKDMVKTGDRSEKIRTYNFPQNRITDHRLEQSWHNLEAIMNGAIGPMLESLRADEHQRLLEANQ